MSTPMAPESETLFFCSAKKSQLSQMSDNESRDTGREICRRGVSPTCDVFSVLANERDASEYSTDDQDKDDTTHQVDSAMPYQNAKVSLASSVDSNAARYSHAALNTTLYQSLILEPPPTKQLPDSAAVQIAETTKSTKGSFENPIVIDSDSDDEDGESARRASRSSTASLSYHSSSGGIDISPSISSGKRAGQKRKRASTGGDEETLRGGKIQHHG